MATPATDSANRRPAGLPRAARACAASSTPSGTTNLGLIVALCVLIVFISLRTPNFLTPQNFLNIALAVSLLGIVAVSQTVVIISGGLDISVGSIAGLASVTTALAVGATASAAAGIGAGIAVGALRAC